MTANGELPAHPIFIATSRPSSEEATSSNSSGSPSTRGKRGQHVIDVLPEHPSNINIYTYVVRDDDSPPTEGSSDVESSIQQGCEWTPEIELLVYRWGQKAVGLRNIHTAAADRTNLYHQMLGIPAILLSAAGSAAAFTSVGSGPRAGDSINPVSLVLGIIGIMVSGLTGVQNFLRFAQRSERHKHFAHKFSALYREIDAELTKPRSKRANAYEFVEIVRINMDHLISESPALPSFALTRRASERSERRRAREMSIDVRSENYIPR